MIGFLVLCLAIQLQAFSRNQDPTIAPSRKQKSTEPPTEPPTTRKPDEKLAACACGDWSLESVYVLNTLSVSMFGLNPMQLVNCKPNLYNPYRGRLRKVWYILRRISHTRLYGISKEVIDQFTRLETQGLSVEPEVKTKLADIFDGLNPQAQRMWIRYFPYAKFIGLLAKMRKSNTEPVSGRSCTMGVAPKNTIEITIEN